ncbi:MAG: sigma-70 family RNA polymerase sigma factor [Phycisphaerales bacterium]|nr:sigma-70 family RNA polymerase sigma factor [Phycisphaerales bacterium]
MQQPPVDPEVSLVAAASRGDTEALRRLWEANRRWVAAVILAHKPRWADADDLLQDVAATLVRKIGQVREEAAFRPWLRTVAINAARAAARGQHHEPIAFSSAAGRAGAGVEIDAPVGAGRGPDSAAPGSESDRRDEGRRLLDLAAMLPEGYREPLLLRCLHDMSYRQIGLLVGLPETTIETRIARGRRMLRELAQGTTSGNDQAGTVPRQARQTLGC